jgi:hypothetical protein
MSDTLQIPPMPKPGEFINKDGVFLELAFKQALAAWKTISEEVVEASKLDKFWNR